jgi:hypothetical protein
MENNLTVEMPEEELIALTQEVRKLLRRGHTVTLYYCDVGVCVTVYLQENNKEFIIDPEMELWRLTYRECMDFMKGLGEKNNEIYKECLEYLSKMKETV